jgi:hypothetical protein
MRGGTSSRVRGGRPEPETEEEGPSAISAATSEVALVARRGSGTAGAPLPSRRRPSPTSLPHSLRQRDATAAAHRGLPRRSGREEGVGPPIGRERRARQPAPASGQLWGLHEADGARSAPTGRRPRILPVVGGGSADRQRAAPSRRIESAVSPTSRADEAEALSPPAPSSARKRTHSPSSVVPPRSDHARSSRWGPRVRPHGRGPASRPCSRSTHAAC